MLKCSQRDFAISPELFVGMSKRGGLAPKFRSRALHGCEYDLAIGFQFVINVFKRFGARAQGSQYDLTIGFEFIAQVSQRGRQCATYINLVRIHGGQHDLAISFQFIGCIMKGPTAILNGSQHHFPVCLQFVGCVVQLIGGRARLQHLTTISNYFFEPATF